jgi:hypothetical protein
VTYTCATCGSTTLIIRPQWVPELEWSITCGNSHPVLPVEGTEYVIEQTEVELS